MGSAYLFFHKLSNNFLLNLERIFLTMYYPILTGYYLTSLGNTWYGVTKILLVFSILSPGSSQLTITENQKFKISFFIPSSLWVSVMMWCGIGKSMGSKAFWNSVDDRHMTSCGRGLNISLRISNYLQC